MGGPSSISELISRINEQIINPLIGLLFALALLYFLWGGVQFLMNVDNEEKRLQGRDHMLWGVIGMFIMVSVWGILEVVTNTFGISLPR